MASQIICRVGDVLVEYEGHCSKSKTDKGPCHTRPFRIEEYPGTAPIASRRYRTKPASFSQVDSTLDSYLAAGLINHSTPYGLHPSWWCPGVTVESVSQSAISDWMWLVLSIGKKTLPRRDRTEHSLGKGRVSPMFDMISGFNQYAINPDSQKMTAFITPQDLFWSSRMPQGHAGTSSAFLRPMKFVIAGLNPFTCILMIRSSSTRLQHSVWGTSKTSSVALRNTALNFQRRKCTLDSDDSYILGHDVCSSGLRPEEKRVDSLAKLSMPADVSQLRSLVEGLS